MGGYHSGRFSVPWEFVGDGCVEFRVVANGYLPQPVRIPLGEDGLMKATTVRLKRGESVRGQVLDHEGKPVENARVFFRWPGSLTMQDGEIERSGLGSNFVRTDANGRFLITGGGKEATHVIVLAPHCNAWLVPAPHEGSKEELTIRLPKPATLKVILDLHGAMQGNEEILVNEPGKGPHTEPAGKDVSLRLHMKTWEMEGWKDSGDFVQNRTVANPGEVVFENLTPGLYDFSRTKLLFLGDTGHTCFCDRQTIKLLPGETKTIRLDAETRPARRRRDQRPAQGRAGCLRRGSPGRSQRRPAQKRGGKTAPVRLLDLPERCKIPDGIARTGPLQDRRRRVSARTENGRVAFGMAPARVCGHGLGHS